MIFNIIIKFYTCPPISSTSSILTIWPREFIQSIWTKSLSESSNWILFKRLINSSSLFLFLLFLLFDSKLIFPVKISEIQFY